MSTCQHVNMSTRDTCIQRHQANILHKQSHETRSSYPTDTEGDRISFPIDRPTLNCPSSLQLLTSRATLEKLWLLETRLCTLLHREVQHFECVAHPSIGSPASIHTTGGVRLRTMELLTSDCFLAPLSLCQTPRLQASCPHPDKSSMHH